MAYNIDHTTQTQAERSAQTRNALLDATVDLLLNKGYDACSLANIAKSANMTTGSVQHHFNTKTEMMLTVIEERIFDVDEAIYIPSEAEITMPLRDRCQLLIDRQWYFYGRQRYLALWAIRLGLRMDDNTTNRVAVWQRKTATNFEAALTKLFPDYDMTAQRTNKIRHFLGVFMRGLALMPLVVSDEGDVDVQLDLLLDLLEMVIASDEF